MFNMIDAVQLLGVVVDLIRNVHEKGNPNPLNFVTITLFLWERALKKPLNLGANLILDGKKGIRGRITNAS